MKQRIRAEAHGSSPSARSVRTGDLAEDISAALVLAEAAAKTAADPGVIRAGVNNGATAGVDRGVSVGVNSAVTASADRR